LLQYCYNAREILINLIFFCKMTKKLLILALMIFAGFSSHAAPTGHDSKAPVEITSDMLEILQNKQKAVFSGNVEAIQGNITINSDTMLVHYKSGDDKKGKSQNSVSKVETIGNVRLKTPKETAKSKKGIFDVEKNIITLTGGVTLESGKNVVKGEKFVYNLKTGKSSIVSGNVKSSSGTKKKERVKGIFIPSQ